MVPPGYSSPAESITDRGLLFDSPRFLNKSFGDSLVQTQRHQDGLVDLHGVHDGQELPVRNIKIVIRYRQTVLYHIAYRFMGIAEKNEVITGF